MNIANTTRPFFFVIISVLCIFCSKEIYEPIMPLQSVPNDSCIPADYIEKSDSSGYMLLEGTKIKMMPPCRLLHYNPALSGNWDNKSNTLEDTQLKYMWQLPKNLVWELSWNGLYIESQGEYKFAVSIEVTPEDSSIKSIFEVLSDEDIDELTRKNNYIYSHDKICRIRAIKAESTNPEWALNYVLYPIKTIAYTFIAYHNMYTLTITCPIITDEKKMAICNHLLNEIICGFHIDLDENADVDWAIKMTPDGNMVSIAQ